MKIIELTIEDLFSEESGVDAVAFVESPAIETKFIYFNSEEFESYNDYPQSARDNACRAIKWAEENGWGSCGTNVGKIRANQLCNGENITEETISRMASFERHRRNSETPYGEGCGKLMWDAWGGDEGIAWAQRKLSQIREEMEIDVSNLPTYVQYPTGQTENDMLIEYFSKCGITEEQFKMEFANASEIPWGEGDILPRNESQGRTFYKYMGPNPERDFCRQLMGLNRLYTYDEIKQSNSLSVNAGFGPNGSNTYDIWFYKGGPNCKHYWQKVYATLRNQESKGPARGRAGTPMFDQPNRGYLEPRNFNEQKFVERLPGEKKDDYLQRCVPVLINEGYPQDQAVAICISDFKNFKTMELTIFGYTTKYFYLCAIAQQLFRKLISEENTRDEVVMIRIGAVILDQLFEIESKDIVTEEDYQNAVKLANDFYEIFEQVQILKGEEYDLTFVENHLDIIQEKLKKKFNKLKFVNEEKRLVVSPLMIPNILIPRMNELTKEKYYVKFSPDTIEQIQRKYNLEGRMRNTNIEHESDNSMKDAVLVENWLVENEKDKIYNYFTKEDVPFGSWVGVYYILETEEGNMLWKKIKSGEVKGLSVEGNFILN